MLSADDGVRRLGAVSLVLDLESVVAKLPATRGCLAGCGEEGAAT